MIESWQPLRAIVPVRGGVHRGLRLSEGPRMGGGLVVSSGMAILILQHSDLGTPGRLGTTLRDHGFRLEFTRPDQPATRTNLGVPKDLDGVEGLVIMGGPQNVTDAANYPWMQQELELIKAAHAAELPVVGVCLGAQMIAQALGGAVGFRSTPSLGFDTLRLNTTGQTDTIFAGMAWNHPQFFSCEQEVQKLPPGAAALAGTKSSPVAAFRAGLRTFGFLFHPDYFYNDVRQNDRYVGALRSYEGSIMERSRKAQVDLGVGYPRIVAGKRYAFPYSPVFYLPFTRLPPDRDIVVRAIKHVALLATVLEVALAFVLARMLVPSAAAAAAWFTFAFPILTSRMLYAMWSTLAGHALDLLVVVVAVRALDRPRDAKWSLLLFGATLATFLTYVSSLFNTSAFLVCLALLAASVRGRVILLWLAAALTVVFGLYGDFTLAFVREILPAILAGSGQPAANAALASPAEPNALVGAFSRIVLFSGWGFPLFALAGLILIARRSDPTATVIKAYALAFLSLVLLRGLSFGLFKDLKEVEFAGPAFAILTAVALARIEWRTARWLIASGLVLTGLWMQYGYFETWSRLVLG